MDVRHEGWLKVCERLHRRVREEGRARLLAPILRRLVQGRVGVLVRVQRAQPLIEERSEHRNIVLRGRRA